MKWTAALVLLLFTSAALLAEEAHERPAGTEALKPLNLNVLPPKPEKRKKSLHKLTPMNVVCEYHGTTWVTKDRADEDRCKMGGGKLRVAAGDGKPADGSGSGSEK
jgi:hypothetical protein